ncbi:MAG: transposase [Phycisphaerae bacterium]|jgi:putative transposase
MHDKRPPRKSWDIPWDAHALTFSCFGRQPFFRGPNAPVWFLESLGQARNKGMFDLWAYVIMPEHIHLLILPHEGETISSILKAIKQPVTRRALAWVEHNRPQFLAKMADRQPNGEITHRFWQRGGGYDRNMRSTSDIHEKIRYMHANPVRRGLVAEPQLWTWSSASAWETGIDEPIPIDRNSVPQLGPLDSH